MLAWYCYYFPHLVPPLRCSVFVIDLKMQYLPYAVIYTSDSPFCNTSYGYPTFCCITFLPRRSHLLIVHFECDLSPLIYYEFFWVIWCHVQYKRKMPILSIPVMILLNFVHFEYDLRPVWFIVQRNYLPYCMCSLEISSCYMQFQKESVNISIPL